MMTTNTRLANTNTVSQQKSLIFVVRDLNESNGSTQKQFFIKNDPNDVISDQSDDENEGSDIQNAQIAYYENIHENKESDVTDSELIWSHKKPSEHDNNATEYFLQVRSSEKYKLLFTDKKFGKYRLWSEIAEEMNNAGYYVGEGRDAAEKCRQKFSNLEKGFLNYVKLARSGHRKKDPPPFYDYMVNLVDPDDRLYKQEQNSLMDVVRDSLQVEIVTAPTKDNNNKIPSSSSKNNDNISVKQSEIINMNFQTENKLKKSKQNNEIITLLSNQHAEIMNLQKEFLDKIDSHLKVQNEQRERMINSFIEAMNNTSCDCTCKKRKRKNSSTSEIENIILD